MRVSNQTRLEIALQKSRTTTGIRQFCLELVIALVHSAED